MSKYLKYFTEADAPPKDGPVIDLGVSVASGDIAGLGGVSNFSNIVVRNPAGDGFKPTEKKRTFGFGFELPSSLAMQVMDVVRQHGDKEAKIRLNLDGEEKERFADTDDPENNYDEIATWQDINKAVGNYVRTKVNTKLEPYKLGAVPSNPVAQYDGLDTTKMGLVVTKPSRAKVKINPAKY